MALESLAPRPGTLSAELATVPSQALEEYARDRILHFAGENAFARRLYMGPETVLLAAKEALAELARPPRHEEITGVSYQLVFRHECLSLGCLDPRCDLCRQAPHRRCISNFAPKYLSGDNLKAKCGAPIRIEVIDQYTGETVPAEKLNDLHLEVCILEGKSYSELTAGAETDKELDDCTLLTNSQGKELLAPGRGSQYNAEKKVAIPLNNGKADLHMSVIGSSIALLSGQKPPFRLLVRAVRSSSHQKANHIRHAVSDAFVVATQRVKTAQKAEIPHIDEHVSKIEYVGVQTQAKLQDIKSAGASVGVYGLNVVHNCITTVGQFKDLVESTEKDVPLCETLKKVLNFTAKGWEVARAHALRAVATDNRMRIWLQDDKMQTGLLFRCNLGRVDLDVPVGLLRKKAMAAGHVTMEATLPAQQNSQERETVVRLQQAASDCWWRPGHPGWSIWPADSEQFIRSVLEAGNTILSPVQIVAPVPKTPHNKHTAPGEAGSGQMQSFDANPHQPPQPEGPYGMMGQMGPPGAVDMMGSSPPQMPASFGGGPLDGPHSLADSSQHSRPFPVPLLSHGNRSGSVALPPSPFDAARNTASPMMSQPGFSGSMGPMGGPGSYGSAANSLMPGFSMSQPLQQQRMLMPGGPQQPHQQLSGVPISATPSGLNPQNMTQGEMEQLLHLLGSNEDNSLPKLLTRLSSLIKPRPSGPGNPGTVGGSMGMQMPPSQNTSLPPPSHANPMGMPPSNALGPPNPLPEQGGPDEGRMIMKLSGKVSGILDDLTEAMTMLQDIVPHAESLQDPNLQQKLLAAQGSLQQAAAASVPSQLEPPSPHEGPSQASHSTLEAQLGPNEAVVLPQGFHALLGSHVGFSGVGKSPRFRTYQKTGLWTSRLNLLDWSIFRAGTAM
ncbi:hypothetical protein WJX74_008974 [Apatococcus lobatus]|uniref:Uncharacterized protein n=1 Tax=Apatococcus lobatus TaxID=904363 RepID=A0AAW1S7B0_9CHLO